MNVIRNDVELKMAWETVLFFEKELKEIAKSKGQEKGLESYVKDVKKSIRKYNAEKKSAPEYRIFDSNCDGYKIFAETGWKSVDEANENYVALSCYPDQIGRWYMAWWKFFAKPNGKVYAYGQMCMNW